MEIKCDIYRSANKPDTYLYLDADILPEDIPDTLKQLLGELTAFLNLSLSRQSKLAQADIVEVLSSLADQGYYLQMPPGQTAQRQAPASGFIQ